MKRVLSLFFFLVPVIAFSQPFPFDYTHGVRDNVVKMVECDYSASSYLHLGDEVISKTLSNKEEYHYSDHKIIAVIKEKKKRPKGVFTTFYDYVYSDGLLTAIRRMTLRGEIQDYQKPPQNSRTDSFTYDGQKRLIEHRQTYHYDSKTDSLKKQQSNGYDVNIVVDQDDVLRKYIYSGSTTTEYYVEDGCEWKAVWSNRGKTRTIISTDRHMQDTQYVEYFDGNGRIIKRDEKYQGKLLYTTGFKYDGFGNLIEEKKNMPGYSLSKPEVISYSYDYDEHHNWLEKRTYHNGDLSGITTREYQYE